MFLSDATSILQGRGGEVSTRCRPSHGFAACPGRRIFSPRRGRLFLKEVGNFFHCRNLRCMQNVPLCAL